MILLNPFNPFVRGKYIGGTLQCYIFGCREVKNEVKERYIEGYMRKRIKEAGGWAAKWVSPGNAGVPDRIVIMPGGRVVFVELKAPGRRPTKLQWAQINRLRSFGCDVRVVDSVEAVDKLVQELTGQ